MHDTCSLRRPPTASVETVNAVLPVDCHPKIRELATYWLTIHPANGLPGRQHFDPVDVPLILPNLWMVDIQQAPLRFRFRLLGTRIVDYAGEDNTGRWVDEKWPNFDSSAFIEIAKSGKPSWHRGASRLRSDRDYYELERVRLPLARNGVVVDMILALTVFFDRQGNEIL